MRGGGWEGRREEGREGRKEREGREGEEGKKRRNRESEKDRKKAQIAQQSMSKKTSEINILPLMHSTLIEKGSNGQSLSRGPVNLAFLLQCS